MKPISRSGFLNILTGTGPVNVIAQNTFLPDNPGGATGKHATTGLTPYTGPMGQDQLLHLIRRTLFGVSCADYNFFSGKTLNECLDILLTQSKSPDPPVNTYNTADLKDPDVPPGKTWVFAPFGDNEYKLNGVRFLNLKAWWVGQMITQNRSLTEKMMVFWSNYMAAQMYMMKDSRLSYSYFAAIRAHVMGNFKSLVREITTNPGMLEYLNGNDNTAIAPNENYSRELQELFTVGKEPGAHYTETDVKEAARVLTGWDTTDTWDNGKPGGVGFAFNAEKHDKGDKKFSAFYGNKVIAGKEGEQGTLETDELIDMIFTKREVAKYFCRNVYRWFVCANITKAIETNIIEPLADVFIENKFEIKPVLKTLLGSAHFFEAVNMGCQIKSPIDHLIGACRQLNYTGAISDVDKQYADWGQLATRLQKERGGMDPGDPPNVAGWPAYYQSPAYAEIWINATTLAERNSTTDFLVNYRFDVLGFAKQLPDPTEPNRLIADSCKLLSAVPFSKDQIAVMKDILLPGHFKDLYWTEIWDGYITNPADEPKRSIIVNRLANLYSHILQRSEYQLN